MISIVCLTDQGLSLAQQLSKQFDEQALAHQILFKPQPFKQTVQACFTQKHRMIMICAAGIVVRTLAPVIQNKYEDAPVVVMDELGQFVVPLLSGHEGGANDWAAELSAQLNAQAVITTANHYINPIYTIGVGCEKNCPIEFVEELIHQCLHKAQISMNHVHSLNSIDIKQHESSFITLADQYEKPFYVYSVPDLRAVESELKTPSDYVFKTVGVYGVAESAALVAAEKYAGCSTELIVAKHKNAKATCAIARSYAKTQASPTHTPRTQASPTSVSRINASPTNSLGKIES